MRQSIVLLLVLVNAAGAQDSGRWRMQYFYDEDRATFRISDLKFPSADRGVAIGVIAGEGGLKPMSVVTSDGGAHWSLVPLKEPGRTLFFLNDSLGWMVTTKGLWRTEESGRSWRKIKAPPDVNRVHFLDPDHGWAVCGQKQIFETTNGGADWSKLAFPKEIRSNPNYTHFNWIAFANKDVGMIGGESTPPRREYGPNLPDWVDPEVASHRLAWPHLTILADTHDGGKTWKANSASLFGHVTTARLSSEGWGLGLIEFSDTFDYPSEVMFLNWRNGGQVRLYREKERKVTDVAIAAPGGLILLAGTEHFGSLQQLPIPRKVKILRSNEATKFYEMPVDYRAVARRVILAVVDPGKMWAATDTGMILKWTP